MPVSSDIPCIHGIISIPKSLKGLKDCPVCHKQFISEQAIMKNVKCHKTSSGFRCNGCKKVLVDLLSLRAHMLTHANTADKFHCTTCGK